MAHGTAGAVSKAAVEKWGKDYPVHPVGTGPYKFQEFVPGERVVLARNDAFWGSRPCFDRIVFRVIPEDGARAAALETGELLTPTTGDGFQQLNELSRSDPDLSRPPSDWNLTHYINPKVDELIRLAGTTTDQPKRKEALKEAQRIIMADAPLVFMYSLDFVLGYKANLTGVRLLPNRFVDLREAQRIK
jgi:ABC-type transport system substrate-binding protein